MEYRRYQVKLYSDFIYDVLEPVGLPKRQTLEYKITHLKDNRFLKIKTLVCRRFRSRFEEVDKSDFVTSYVYVKVNDIIAVECIPETIIREEAGD